MLFSEIKTPYFWSELCTLNIVIWESIPYTPHKKYSQTCIKRSHLGQKSGHLRQVFFWKKV